MLLGGFDYFTTEDTEDTEESLPGVPAEALYERKLKELTIVRLPHKLFPCSEDSVLCCYVPWGCWRRKAVITDGPVYHVGGDITEPKFRRAPEPEYNELARMLGMNAVSVVHCVFGSDAAMRECKIVKPAGAGLDQQSMMALKGWKFQPATRQGNPVSVDEVVQFTFRTDLSGDYKSVVNRLQEAVRSADLAELGNRAAAGDRQAQLLSGYLYWTGRDQSKFSDVDLDRSIDLLKKAAEQGSGTAAYLLGFIDQNTEPKEFDYARCYKWWAIAWVAKMPIDKNTVGYVATKLEPKELSTVQNEARQWLATHKMENDLPK